MSRSKFGVVLIATLFLFSACERQKDEVTETGNSKFLSFVGSDSLSTEFIFSEGDPVILSLTESQIDGKIKLSDIMMDYRLLSLKNWEGGVVGDIDKILLSDSLVFILDEYTFNSLQIFDLFTGEQVGQFLPTGEGPKEMKTISKFDLDEANRRILIYDNSLAKVLYFSFEGDFLFEKRLPLRAHSFKAISENQLLFLSIIDGNEHLGKTSKSDLFLLDSNFKILKTFLYPSIDQSFSSYIPRDVLRENGDFLTYFPRFSNELLEVDVDKNSLSMIFQVNLGPRGLSQEDLNSIGPEFTTKRKEDKKFYGFGFHFISPTWMGMRFNRSGGPELQLFYNKVTQEVFSGTRFEFDFEDLIFYSFPMAFRGNMCISSVRISQLRDIDLNDFFSKREKDGREFTSIKSFLDKVEDFEQPVLLIFDLK
jgi:hypothetical protein